MSEQKSNKRTLEGVVVSNKGDKTVVVEVERKFLHPRYRKTVRLSKKYMAQEYVTEFTGQSTKPYACAVTHTP